MGRPRKQQDLRVTTSFSLPKSLVLALTEHAEKNHQTRSDVMTAILDHWAAREHLWFAKPQRVNVQDFKRAQIEREQKIMEEEQAKAKQESAVRPPSGKIDQILATIDTGLDPLLANIKTGADLDAMTFPDGPPEHYPSVEDTCPHTTKVRFPYGTFCQTCGTKL